MSILNANYQVEEGENGLHLIRVTGRCTADEQTTLESGVCGRYRLVTLPAASGHVLKALDGSAPLILVIRPPTGNKNYQCVKVGARCTPFAPVQEASSGPNSGQGILFYELTYVEVGGVV